MIMRFSLLAQGTRRETTPLEAYKYLVEEVKLKPTATTNQEKMYCIFWQENQIKLKLLITF